MKDRQKFQSNEMTDLTLGSYQKIEVNNFTTKTYHKVRKEVFLC